MCSDMDRGSRYGNIPKTFDVPAPLQCHAKEMPNERNPWRENRRLTRMKLSAGCISQGKAYRNSTENQRGCAWQCQIESLHGATGAPQLHQDPAGARTAKEGRAGSEAGWKPGPLLGQWRATNEERGVVSRSTRSGRELGGQWRAAPGWIGCTWGMRRSEQVPGRRNSIEIASFCRVSNKPELTVRCV